uniref:Peptidase_M14 domain-containing protein n=1 Tax=Syphacia muris TaxID=451379 RepID=A0A0N5AL09_9BILA
MQSDLVKLFEENGWIENAEVIKNHIGPFIEPTEFRHHNYTDQRYPHLTHLYSIGKSVQGRELPVITIALNPSYEDPNVPDFKYVANMHGNEVTGRELCLMLIQVLLENYGKNEYLTRLVNTTSIHIMPTMNPDGYEMATEGDVQGVKGRRNANMVDLNRDFPNRFYPLYKSPQPETLAVMNWTKKIPFVLSANLHDGTMLVNYPYDDGTNDRTVAHTPDHNLFVRLAYSYARSHTYMWKKGPRCLPDYGGEPRTGITNGAEWYPVSGGMQDWNYVNTDCFEITVEMSCQKFPYARELPRIWNEHKYALIGYISQVHKSLTGMIRDRITGRGIDDVEVQVRDAGKIVHSKKGGAYFRLLNPGRYTVVFGHPNYEPVSYEFSTLEVPYKRLDITMTPRTARATYSGKADS